LAAALAHLGRLDEAHSVVKAGIALDAAFSISRARAARTARTDDLTYLAQLGPIFHGMREAGVPEGALQVQGARNPSAARIDSVADGRGDAPVDKDKMPKFEHFFLAAADSVEPIFIPRTRSLFKRRSEGGRFTFPQEAYVAIARRSF
jgi:hypothetical protein